MSIFIDRRTIRTNKEDFGYGTRRYEYQQQRATIRSHHIIWFIVGLIDAVLGFRFIFEVFGANPYSGFAQFIYSISYPFMQPFRSLFGVTNVANYSYFDWSVLIAIVVYLLIGYGLVQLLRIVNPSTTEDIHHRMVV